MDRSTVFPSKGSHEARRLLQRRASHREGGQLGERPELRSLRREFLVQFAASSSRTLNVGLLESLRRGPDAEHDDIEIAGALARLVHDDLERYGT